MALQRQCTRYDATRVYSGNGARCDAKWLYGCNTAATTRSLPDWFAFRMGFSTAHPAHWEVLYDSLFMRSDVFSDPSTSTISPLILVWDSAHSSNSASVPRRNSSNFLEISLAMTAWR